jgi:hypothetical protein
MFESAFTALWLLSLVLVSTIVLRGALRTTLAVSAFIAALGFRGRATRSGARAAKRSHADPGRAGPEKRTTPRRPPARRGPGNATELGSPHGRPGGRRGETATGFATISR